ncbi:cadherin repeat domain-containing protein [Catenovulum sediminis]|uniref:cadherin repeat domain-containing protein n=1 Tax=Catenovulum sediminis TaxID=1740262 RepID=UPI00117CAB02|nr:cadherin repeat domain-containing protein [Catenovulum sediminis]
MTKHGAIKKGLIKKGVIQKGILKLSLLASIIALAGCDINSDDNDEQAKESPVSGAVVQTVAPDYSSSQVVLIDTETFELTEGLYVKDKSDYTINTYQSEIYHIGKFTIDTIEKYDAADIEQQIYNYSTQQAGEEVSGNPYKIVFLNDSKAFIVRYGSDKVLIVNPQATSAADFITGEIDISAYITDDSIETSPYASDAIIAGGKLFVVMQRMLSWAPQTSYLAVFDTETGEELETNTDSSDSVKGIPLAGFNPKSDSLYVYDNSLYVTTESGFSSVDVSESKIEKINLADYALTEVLNATDIDGNTTDKITEAVILNNQTGYFYAGSGWPTVSALYQFNPTTGDIINTNVASGLADDEGISDIALDDRNQLWISVNSTNNPGIEVYSTADHSLVENRISTTLNPGKISFIRK